ncbi:TMV resistance protein N-like isoform X2 [Apium graveolens]|uniref:TMV resistance protein N-like isoform X2 n=1 Tax=Apium graveolens TaxID=4045 RepID=UPI003D78F09F
MGRFLEFQRDDPELRSGNTISRALPQAIRKSKVYIVVLSKNYAFSSWCLDELVEIFKCSKRMKRLIVPVFYYINPHVVRRQTESFGEAFKKHQTGYDMEKVKTWRLTLNEVADISGYHISENRYEADIIKKVVDRVSIEASPITLNVAKFPVGLDSRVKGVTALFNSDTDGVTRIGIHGMGGIGKTTLAKAVYNQNYLRFQGSCFLANVREVSGMRNGLVSLQQQLIGDVLKCNNINIHNVDQGIELIRARIFSKKVLVVIDDLDDPKPLEYLEGSFALGSMVIITTRNEDLLDRIKVKAKYKVNKMDEDESRQLFNQHAFGDGKISSTFLGLSKPILEHAGGLPLALQVFGSNLLNESEEEWRWFIDKLHRVPIDDIEKNLMISFYALKSVDPILQDIFLDIACFYIGWKKEDAAKIMETCYTFVNRNIEILKKRSLITISDEDKLGMHDLLRDMGKRIARNESPDEPEKHSRLWISEDIHSVLKKHKGTKAIQGIISSNYRYGFETALDQGVSFAAQTFKRMSKLRFLYLNKVNLTGSFEHTFEDLRWFCWKRFPLKCLPSEFYAQKLVTLELPDSEMRTMWDPNMVPQVFDNLKTLNMSSSPNLITTPDFTRLPVLETLNLRDCSSLEEVHISIGSLVRLVSLNLENCSNLRSLPDSICSLRALEVLNITCCTGLEELPDQLEKIKSLKELHAVNVNLLKMLPSIDQLSNLDDLDLRHCNNLLSISELPPNLKRIEAENCWAIERLPDLSNLKQLKRLNLRNCEVLTELQGLEEVTSLEYLNLSNCVCMERLPNLSNLKYLEELDLTNCNGLTEILGLEGLTSLRKLYLTGCNSSLLTYTLTKRFFQIFSEFGHKIEIYFPSAEYPDRIECMSKMSTNSQSSASYNFLALIFCFNTSYSSRVNCSINNTTRGLTWADTLYNSNNGDVLVVILPDSILSLREGDDIAITAVEEMFYGLHLTNIDSEDDSEDDSVVDNVENERRSNHSDNDLERSENWLSPGSTAVNVEQKRSYPTLSVIWDVK